MKPLVVVLGLAGIAGFSWASWNSMHEGISSDLTAKAQAALQANDLDGVSVEFDHLDGLVSGASTVTTKDKAKHVILEAIPAGRVVFVEDADSSTEQTAQNDRTEKQTSIAEQASAVASESQVAVDRTQFSTNALVADVLSKEDATDILEIADNTGNESGNAGIAKEQATDQIAIERAAQLAAERALANAQLAAEQAERLAEEETAARRAAEKAETERLAQEEEAARLAAEKAEAERLAQEEEAARLAAEKAEIERLAQEEEAARLAAEQAEAERLVREEEAARIAVEKAEVERLAREEAASIAAERAVVERLAREETARLAAQKAEAERLANENLLLPTVEPQNTAPEKDPGVNANLVQNASEKDKRQKTPRFGVYMTGKPKDAIVRFVQPNSSAYKAGLRKGDVLKRLGPYDISEFSDVAKAVGKYQVGDKVEAYFQRNTQLYRTKVLFEKANPSDSKTISKPAQRRTNQEPSPKQK